MSDIKNKWMKSRTIYIDLKVIESLKDKNF